MQHSKDGGRVECADLTSCYKTNRPPSYVFSADRTLLFKGCNLDAAAGLGVTTAGLANPGTLCTLPTFTQLSHELRLCVSSARVAFQSDCYCTVVHQRRVRAGEWAKVCGGQALLCSAASVEKQHIFFLFRLQPTRHRYGLAHSTAHMSSSQSTK